MTAHMGVGVMRYNINWKNVVTAPFPRISKAKWTLRHFVGEGIRAQGS